MQILNNSPLQSSGNYYLNNPDFNSQLFFTDANATQSFIICRYDWDDSVWKVIYNGKLQGYSNTTYQYRFDFDKYIKVEQPRDFNFQMFGDFENILYQDINKMTSKVSIVLNGTNDILATYTTKYTTQTNGEIWLNSDPSSFADTMANTVIDYKFIDKSDSNMSPYPSIKTVIAQTWLPITTYSSSSDDQTYVIMYDEDGVEIAGHSVWADETGVGKQFMFYIPANTAYIELSTQLNPNVTTLPVKNRCIKSYYYWGKNSFEVIYFDGKDLEIENTTKEYITIGNKQYPIKINTVKQIKQHTGFSADANQIYDLYKSPYAFSAYNGELEVLGRNFLNNSQSPIWHHNTADIWITNVLMTDEFEPYRRVTPTATHTINLYGMYYEYLDTNYYIASCMVRQNSGGALSYNIYESPKEEPTSTFTLQSGVWTKIYTKAYESIAGNGKNIIIQQTGTETEVALDIKNCQIELENENYITYSNGIGYMYKLEKDGLPTDWKPSLADSGTDKVKLKRWLIDNTSFEGYNGSLLNERNIELILTDEQSYKRKTNVHLNFFD